MDVELVTFKEYQVSETKQICVLHSKFGKKTIVGFDAGSLFENLALRGEADVAIVSTEEGFSPLGGSRDFFEKDLGISYEEEIKPIANWNRFDNEKVTLVAIPSRKPASLLKGIILAPGQNCLSYRPFGNAYEKRPSRDFYYNVAYEAIKIACCEWDAKEIAISHLSSSGKFHADMATCQVEALAHFCDSEHHNRLEKFTYCWCCIDDEHLSGIKTLNAETKSQHQEIKLITEKKKHFKLIHLDWSGNK